MHHHAPIKTKRSEIQSATVDEQRIKSVVDSCRCGAERLMEFKEDGSLNRSTGWRKD
jgi:hypothetical protein